MATSTIPAFRTALLELLVSNLSTWQVSRLDQGATARRARIFLGAAEDGEQESTLFRATPHARDETYVQIVNVEDIKPGSDSAAELSVLAAAGTIETFLRADPKLEAATTAPGIIAAQVIGLHLDDLTETTDGTRARLEVQVEVRARI